MNKEVQDPYKILFTLGSFFGLLGVSLWILFEWGWYPLYPRQAHAQLMFFGFLWSFVAGFLMTAIPRMTTGSYAKVHEIILISILLSLQVLVNIKGYLSFSALIFLLQNIFLVFFVVSRFFVKKKIPFEGFLYMPVAFAMSFLGLFLYLFNGSGSEKALYLFCGEAFILNLILGLGSRMIPALSRIPNAFMSPELSIPIRWRRVIPFVLMLNIGFIAEYTGYVFIGNILRLIVIIYAAIFSFSLFKKPTVFSFVGLGLKVGVLFMILGPLLVLIGNEYRVMGIHLLYIGGFSLITLMVATRVTLAHSQLGLDYELSSKRILLIIMAFSLAALSRFQAGNSISGFWITLSFLFVTLGLLLWLHRHLLIQLKVKN